MATLIFRLRNVPDEEAQAVRKLLDDHELDWYETSAGNWGIAMPGLWVRHDEDVAKARAVIDQYQAEHAARVRDEYRHAVHSGESKSLLQTLFENPLKSTAIIGFCLFIIYVTITPFLKLIEQTSQ